MSVKFGLRLAANVPLRPLRFHLIYEPVVKIIISKISRSIVSIMNCIVNGPLIQYFND